MKPDLILGFDPAPGDSGSLITLSDGLRKVIRAVVEARQGLDQLSRAGSVWDGAVGEPIAAVLRRYSVQLSSLEASLVDCLQAVDGWREGVEQRQSQVTDIVSAVAELAGEPDADARRTRLTATAREIGDEHDRAASQLASVFADLSLMISQLLQADDDLAAELDRALTALAVAVEDWIDAESHDLLRTAVALGEVAGLTTVISELVGVAALGRTPGQAQGVAELISRSPGSHRLVSALRRQWLEVAPADLPAASFTTQGQSRLSLALSGKPAALPDESPAK